MLNDDELQVWSQRLNLSARAQALIAQIRSSPPARRVGSRAGNVSGRYPSRKMGVTIQFESHRHELAAIYELEHDPAVLEFYDQPPSIKLAYEGAHGRRIGVIHTPDYFVIRTDSAGYEECKPEQELRRLAEKSPQRYQRHGQGPWCCPPGEIFAAQYGLYYRLRSSGEINWTYQRNLQFLQDYWRADEPTVAASVRAAVCSLVSAEFGISLSRLIWLTAAVATLDDIYTLIATGEVYANLEAAPLLSADQVQVFSSRDAALASAYAAATDTPAKAPPPATITLTVGHLVIWDGNVWTMANVGERTIALAGDRQALIEVPRVRFEQLVREGRLMGVPVASNERLHPEARGRLMAASVADYREANRRAEVVRSRLRGEALPPGMNVPPRTLRLWAAQYRAAEASYGAGYIGLLPQIGKRGNRGSKLPDNTRTVLVEFIEREYETLKQKTKYAAYAALLQACSERSVVAPSYKTFSREVKRRATAEQTLKRQGRRAAYQQQTFYWELELQTPRHGDRPFEICHLDHTEADVELRCSQTHRVLGRPWATFLTDAYSRRLLAVYLTFDRPSYRSCMMVLRECVRRHGRLPQILVVDGGRDFESTYFETLLARYECTKKTRPRAQPRFGSVCERLFGTANTHLFHNLVGNTQLMRHERLVTKEVNPKEHALWPLGRLYARTCEWAYELYDSLDHPALGQSPRAAFAAGIVKTGQRPQRLIPYNEDFLMWTLPTTTKGTAQVSPGRGVKIQHLRYWCEAFRHPEIEQTQVPVRYDPYDAGRAYAFVSRQWFQCHSEYYAVFEGRSERELMLATEELRARRREHSRRFTVSAKQLAAFLQSVEAEEALLMQRLRDREARSVLTVIEGGKAASGINREVSAHDSGGSDPDAPLQADSAEEARELYQEF